MELRSSERERWRKSEVSRGGEAVRKSGRRVCLVKEECRGEVIRWIRNAWLRHFVQITSEVIHKY